MKCEVRDKDGNVCGEEADIYRFELRIEGAIYHRGLPEWCERHRDIYRGLAYSDETIIEAFQDGGEE